MRQILTLSPVALLVLVLPALALAQIGDVSGVHDPCIIHAGDLYYVFCTGNGIPIRTSRDLVTWQRAGRAIDALPGWATDHVPGARSEWAPDISFFNGTYHLYYAVSSFGSRRSCIGLAINDTLDPADPRYKWRDGGKVIETVADDNWNAIDANLALDADGKPWLTMGSFWTGIKMIRLDPATGLRSKEDNTLHALARRTNPSALEAPFLVRHGEMYYLFVSFDLCCRGANSTYNIRVGRAKEITGPYADRDGKPMLDGGGTLVLESQGTVRGPGHQAVLQEPRGDFLVHHFYDAADRGRPKLQIRPMTWDEAGWPQAGEPVAKAPTTAPAFNPGATTRPGVIRGGGREMGTGSTTRGG